jgi:hypothetical protein
MFDVVSIEGCMIEVIASTLALLKKPVTAKPNNAPPTSRRFVQDRLVGMNYSSSSQPRSGKPKKYFLRERLPRL